MLVIWMYIKCFTNLNTDKNKNFKSAAIIYQNNFIWLCLVDRFLKIFTEVLKILKAYKVQWNYKNDSMKNNLGIVPFHMIFLWFPVFGVKSVFGVF